MEVQEILERMLLNRGDRVDRFDGDYIDDFDHIVRENKLDTTELTKALGLPAGTGVEELTSLIKNLDVIDRSKFQPLKNDEATRKRFKYNQTEIYNQAKSVTSEEDVEVVLEIQKQYSFDVKGGNNTKVGKQSFWGRRVCGDVWTPFINEHVDKSGRALCIGPRWGAEIDFFRSELGIPDTIGIDLKSFDETKVVSGDAHNMPFDDNTFSLVYQKNTFNKLYDIRKCLHECARILKPGGIIISDTCMDYTYGVSELARTNITSVQWFVDFFQSNGLLDEVLLNQEVKPNVDWVRKFGFFAARLK